MCDEYTLPLRLLLHLFSAYDFFLAQFVKRRLVSLAQKTIRLELLREHSFPHAVGSFATLKEEIFLTRSTSDQSPVDVEVYERNNMAELKDIIAISGLKVMNIEACNVSNCVYVLCRRTDESNCLSVLRMKKDSEHRYNISTWISDLGFLHASISVLPNGILSVAHGYNPVALKHYDANGSLVLSSDVSGLGFVDRVLQKANGNFVLATLNLDKDETVLTEMDTFGKVRGQYISFIDAMSSSVHFADPYDRIMITDKTEEGIELLDSELNLLEFEGRELLSVYIPIELSYSNSQRNELVFICTDGSDLDDSPRIVSTFRITEE